VGVSKRKHTPITISQKIEICIEKNKDPNIKNNQLAFKYNAGESTVSDILKK
ncbi:3833_t:CDS:1, partial [Entrophospora sp. SA101]